MALNTLPNEGLTNRGYPSDRIVTPIIINGDMSVAQRTTSTSSVSSGATYIVDRFFVSPSSAGTWTMSQSTTTPTGQGFGKSFKMDCTSATTSLGAAANLIFQQRIEGQNLQALKKGTSSAEAVTFSFWVRSNKTGTYTLEMYDNDNTRQISKTYTISSADTWEKKTVNFAGDTTGAFDNDNASSLTILFWLGAGSNFTSGTFSESWSSATTANRVSSSQVNLADSASNEWYITGLQMEVGEFDSTSIPSFPFESFENNLIKCMRYYQKFGSTAPTSCNMVNGMCYSANSSEVFFPTILPVVMRTGPTVSQNGTIAYRTPGGTKNLTLNSTAVSEKEVFINFSGSSLTSGDPGYIRNPDGSSGNNIEMTAEL
jgi:hypothetical protein